MTKFLSAHGVRVYAVLSALVPLLLAVYPTIPWETALPVAAALLGVGVAAARHEDTKTLKALYEDSPFEAELRGE
ncbi:hypothetical protein [Streptomyces wuyuanensis]|uniref:hypothetical protein n=1 Tax=Streptomyces wuyuanensis TaxID=1196353 RepID=UPI003412AD7B